MSESKSVFKQCGLPETGGARDLKSVLSVNLPAPLNTGHGALDFEHQQLLAIIALVRSLCEGFESRVDCTSCSLSNRLQCESSLVGILGDLLAFVLEHFQREERIMRDSFLINIDRAMCEAHMEDHADISLKIQQIVAALDPNRNVVMIRELDALLVRWIDHHIVMHDRLLAEHVKKTGLVSREFLR